MFIMKNYYISLICSNHARKTKFIFEPRRGQLYLEQLLPMPWHSFNRVPNFEVIILSQSNFVKCIYLIVILIYFMVRYGFQSYLIIFTKLQEHLSSELGCNLTLVSPIQTISYLQLSSVQSFEKGCSCFLLLNPDLVA